MENLFIDAKLEMEEEFVSVMWLSFIGAVRF